MATGPPPSVHKTPYISIRPGVFPANKVHVSSLLQAYLAWMPSHLRPSSQIGIEEEVEGVPGKYAKEAGGGLWLAFLTPLPSSGNGTQPLQSQSETPVGLVCLRNLNSKHSVGQVLTLEEEAELGNSVSDALKPHFPGNVGNDGSKKKICELKRLFTKVETRGLGVGKALMRKVIHEAKAMGYEEMRLDTAIEAVEAIALYETLGFVRCERYNVTGPSTFIFMKLDLGMRR